MQHKFIKMTFIKENYKKIADYSQNLSIKNQEIKPSIIVVTKNRPISSVTQAIKFGIRHFAENRLQEAISKFVEIKKKHNDIELHMTGPMQTNKVKKSLEIFDVFHTLDREKLALEFNKNIGDFSINKKKSFFIQVNTGNEPQKSGIATDQLFDFFNYCNKDLSINIIGLMCIPPIDEDPQEHFILLKNLAKNINLKFLSMGMSADYKTALTCGATHIRIGSLLFDD